MLRRGHVNCGDAFGIHHARSHQVLQVKSERVLYVCSFQLGMQTMRHFKEERIDEDVRVDEDDLFDVVDNGGRVGEDDRFDVIDFFVEFQEQ